MIYLELVFKVRINYKSGQHVVYEFTKFNIKRNNNEVTQVTYDDALAKKGAIFINVGAIESIWQEGVRVRLRFGRKPK